MLMMLVMMMMMKNVSGQKGGAKGAMRKGGKSGGGGVGGGRGSRNREEEEDSEWFIFESTIYIKSNYLQSQVFLTIMTTVNQDHVLDSASSSISNILKVSRSRII